MSWICERDDGTELVGHRGMPIAVDAAGAELPPGDTESTAWWRYDGRDGRPRATGLLAGCECGWRSKAPHPITWDDREATELRPLAVWDGLHAQPLLGRDLPLPLADAMLTVYQQLGKVAKARPLVALRVVRELEAIAGTAAHQATVQARSRGVTWFEIGRELGITRQAAHQRLGRHVLPEDTSESLEVAVPAPTDPDLSGLPEPHRAALTVTCPACGSAPGELCTSHSGTRTRKSDVHQARTKAHQAAD
ncbi:hypothetical protein ACFV5N_11755 [Streptomyces sp. NPDC059853]|uniref:zinc finger domain-containing protein n=1 Tax=Streptomyces sp. NPDC059853 TaxID=3346973 RepID=UPI003669FF4E